MYLVVRSVETLNRMRENFDDEIDKIQKDIWN